MNSAINQHLEFSNQHLPSLSMQVAKEALARSAGRKNAIGATTPRS